LEQRLPVLVEVETDFRRKKVILTRKLSFFWFVGAFVFLGLGAGNFISYGADPSAISTLVFAIIQDIIAVGWLLIGVGTKNGY
jgi:hypothetical protein